MLFKKKNEIIEETNDILIVFDDDKKISDVQHITDIDENSVTVRGMYKVPLEDCEVTNSPTGRNFFYRAPTQSITETKRLAQLEKAIVLQHITSYKPPTQDSIDFMKIGLLIAVIVAFLMFGVSSCSG